MTFSADDEETTQLLDLLVIGDSGRIATKLDVDAATGHVGGDGNGANFTRLSDNLTLPLVVLGIQDFVFDTSVLEALGKELVVFDRDRADEDWLAAVGNGGDFLGQGRKFALLSLKN